MSDGRTTRLGAIVSFHANASAKVRLADGFEMLAVISRKLIRSPWDVQAGSVVEVVLMPAPKMARIIRVGSRKGGGSIGPPTI